MKKKTLRDLLFLYDITLVLLIIYVFIQTGSINLAASTSAFFLTISSAIALIAILFYTKLHLYDRYTVKKNKKNRKKH